APPPRPVLPPIPLPPAMGELVGGGWRLDFAANRLAIEQQSGQTLRAIGQRLAETTTGRILLLAQASGPQDASTARRLSLDRAIAVKEALQAGGLPGTRVDIRALGQLPAGLDAVDILPPGAPRP
ncbi:MAG: hypothetical protein K2X11_19920, partial [Acetobacteraceae bacterium]|nr:hypothetical protein [Acetobacteraceae bacterium]